MYPVVRMLKEMFVHRNAPALGITGTHISTHVCWPWDIDLWLELNNGRTLTLYDLGRIPLAHRTGLIAVLKRKRWGLTMAGASVRYRQRVRPFEVIKMHSRALGWDNRFMYLEQSMWKVNGSCANQIVYRAAVTSTKGIVSPDAVFAELRTSEPRPKLPAWVQAWIDADASRPWPPEKPDS